MRIVIDAMCADYGGIATYAQHLLEHWPTAALGDELHVVCARGSRLETFGHVRHEVPVRRPASVSRPLAQSLALPRVVREVGADAVLATATTTTAVATGAPLAVVVHDLRHELLPHQFSRARRTLKDVSFARSYRLAAGFVVISARTLGDFERLHPRAARKPSVVVHHGADHVLAWPPRHRAATRAVAFAHHSNKRPDLVLEGWAAGRDAGLALPPLTVLGASGPLRHELADLVARRGLGDRVEIAGYLPTAAFQEAMAAARLVVFPSELEGFGLPVVESMLLGVPVVVSPEPALLEVAGGHAQVMADWSPGALAEAAARACAQPAGATAAARDHAAAFRWERTARRTRSFLAELRISR